MTARKAAPKPDAAGGTDAAPSLEGRIAALEGQVDALSVQVDNLAKFIAGSIAKQIQAQLMAQ